MADKRSNGDPKKPLQEESIVARLKSGASGELAGLTSYIGLLGRSSKEGYWLLYPSLDMGQCIEIQESDIVHSEPLPPEQSPFGGLGGTRVFVRKGAQVTTTRTVSRTSQAGAGDEFDLDIRVGQAGAPEPATKVTLIFSCENSNCPTCRTCPDDTCQTCQTACQQATCNTCPTRCNQVTCAATCNTCNTQCQQNTCNTCFTRCNQFTCGGTCNTCNNTQCNQNTCNTCETQCFQDTCRTVCFGTCNETCHPRCTRLCPLTDVC